METAGIVLTYAAAIVMLPSLLVMLAGVVFGFAKKNWRVLKVSSIVTGASLVVWIIAGMASGEFDRSNAERLTAEALRPTSTPKPPDVTRCFSAWDGHHRKFTDLVKTNLNDPGSLEAIETKYSTSPNAEGLHYVYMDFTAKNLFGGRVRHLAEGWFHPETCETILVSIE